MTDTLNRRDFLRMSGGAVGAVGAVAVGSAFLNAREEPGKKRAIKKAIMYATLGYPGPVMEQFRAVKAAGFEGVEPMSHMKQDEVLRALEENGLKAASVCCNTHWKDTLSDPDPEVRRRGLEGLVQALKDARHYGASSVLLVPGVVNNKVSYEECFQRSVAEIRKAAPIAGELGVKIAVENVWNNFITKPQQAVEFLDAIDSPQVGWHFDIGNCLRYSPSETWIPVIGKRILKLHIKEYSQFKKFNVRLLEGDDHWPAIMKALDDVGYQGWGISEQPGEQAKDEEALKDLSHRMDKVFAS
jgi:L-ribulose-5-phosphate 3-epimerase